MNLFTAKFAKKARKDHKEKSHSSAASANSLRSLRFKTFSVRSSVSSVVKKVFTTGNTGITGFVDWLASCENLPSVKLHINGEAREFAASLSLASLIEMLGMKADRVAVELNRSIVPREQWAQTNLGDGDQLEIVQFVGGG